jgi:hypothetical protein
MKQQHKKQVEPIAWGKKIEGGRLVVDCPFGNHEHLHGVSEGGRVPHCGGGSHYVIKHKPGLSL